MMAAQMPPYVTPVPWAPKLQHPQYGTEDTYRLAAAWLAECEAVADWGGGTGFFKTCLSPQVRYTVVDGTKQSPNQVLADLMTYREPSDGILLRHVLEYARDWRVLLQNAQQACRRRLVVVTFTPDVPLTRIAQQKSGWSLWHFNQDDVARELEPGLVVHAPVQTSHPEHIYYWERPRCG